MTQSPMGGFNSYGPPRREFTLADQAAAIVGRYGSPVVLYDCGICGGFHPNGFHGDCRQDLFRVGEPDEVFPGGWDEIEMADAD